MTCEACKRPVDKLVEIVDMEPSGLTMKIIRCEDCMDIAMELWKGRKSAWLN